MSVYSHLVDALLPKGGFVAHMVEAYFDESGTHDGSPIMVVGGFLIDSEAARELDRAWADMLLRYKLPFFHMTDCALGFEEYRKLGPDGCIAVATEAIQLIRSHIRDGVMISLEPQEFEHHRMVHHLTGQAYSFSATSCLAGVENWANRRNYNGDIAYFFESGHRHEGEANRIMNKIFKTPELRNNHRYVSHRFADKRKVTPLQAADLIAWQWFTEKKRQIQGVRPNMRADTLALMEPNPRGVEFKALHYDRDTLAFVTRSAYKHLVEQAFGVRLISDKE